MKAVGIKQLKARLSEYVRLARVGETVLVSNRGEVVAELGPPRHQRAEDGSLDATLDRLAASGRLRRASRPKDGFVWSPPSLGLSPGAADELLAELRGDR